MPDFIEEIEQTRLDASTKGMPLANGSVRLGDVGLQGWNVARGDMMLPLLTLRDEHLRNNLEVMRRYAEHHSVSLAPHGKSTFCPQLYREQLTVGGSWGITASTVQQALLCARAGAKNVLLANEIVGRANVEQYAALHDAFADVNFFSLVDSEGSLEQLERYGGALIGKGKRFAILLEVGFPGGRAGVRSLEQARSLLDRIMTATDRFDLAGVECYEGLVSKPSKEETLAEIDRLLNLTLDVFSMAREAGAFQSRNEIILTAGGSVYYDRVVSRFRHAQTGPGVRIVLRGGSSVTYDHGVYRNALADMDARRGFETEVGVQSAVDAFTPALELWGAVVTMQDDGLAVVNMGIRDLPFDLGYPIPLRRFRDGELVEDISNGQAGGEWRIPKANDQHCYLTYPDGADLKVGDVISFGISHPCTAFDKWKVIYRVNNNLDVTGALKTFF